MAWNFQDELSKWGPDAPEKEIPSLADSREYCKKLALGHYENFPVVSWILPKEFRPHFYHVYSYCRWSDDLSDEVADPEESLRLLDWWKQELENCYENRVTHPVMIALNETITTCQIPKEPFLDLISAFEQDQVKTRYETFEELLDYCSSSANPVGRLILYVCREFSEEKAILSDHICTGLQLANFWQDVSRDRKMGRIYLPSEDLRKYDCDKNLTEINTERFRDLMEFEVARTREIFKQGEPLIGKLSGRIQLDVDLFLLGGLKILDKIERMDYQVLEKSPVISKTEVPGLFLKAISRYFRRRRDS